MTGRSPGRRAHQRGTRRAAAAALLVAQAQLVLASHVRPASAHANLVRSNPASGAVATTAPAQVQLWFSEQPDPHFSDVQVLDANRQRVDAGDMHAAPGDPLSLIVGIRPAIPDGLYTVSWKTVSAVDGHVVNGNFPFYVGQPPQGTVLPSASQAGPASVGSSPTPATVLTRWLSLLSAIILLGGFAFWPLILLPALRGAIAPRPGPGAMAASPQAVATTTPVLFGVRRNAVGLASLAWLLLAVVTVAVLLQQAQSASGVGLSHVFGAPLRTLLLSTRFGHTWWLRAGATLLSGVALLFFRRQALARQGVALVCLLGAVATEAVLLSYSLNSHAAALTSSAVLATAADLVHLTAAGLWVGGLAQLVVVLPVCLRAVEPDRRLPLLAALVPRFSVLAGISVAALALTGAYQALRELPSLDSLWQTNWGLTLLVKLLLIVPLLLLGAANLLVARPALGRAAREVTAGNEHRLEHRFLGVVAAEALLGVLILLVVGVLVNQPPPQSAAAAAPGIHLTSKAEGVTVKLTIAPGQLGPNHVDASVDVHGKPPPDGTQLVLRLTYADADMGTSEVTTHPLGNGRFSADTSDLSTYGHWQILALVQPPSADEVRTDFTMALSSAGSSGAGVQASGDASVKKGQQLYVANCAQCHGNDARGDGPSAKQLDPPPANLIEHVPQHSDQQLLDWITNGIPTTAMPAFGSKLRPADRQAILNYLRDLTKNATPAPVTPSPAPAP